MNDMEKDLNYLIETAKEATKVLRRNAEYFEAQGKEANDEREAVRWLNLAIQLVQYDIPEPDEVLDERSHGLNDTRSLDEERPSL
jgi:hypothetical protein